MKTSSVRKGNDSAAHLRNETIYYGIFSQFTLLWKKTKHNSQGECQHDGGGSAALKLTLEITVNCSADSWQGAIRSWGQKGARVPLGLTWLRGSRRGPLGAALCRDLNGTLWYLQYVQRQPGEDRSETPRESQVLDISAGKECVGQRTERRHIKG